MSRTILQTASKVSTGAGLCAAAGSVASSAERAREDPPSLHFKSALMGAGASNVAGSTLSYSTDVSVMTC